MNTASLANMAGLLLEQNGRGAEGIAALPESGNVTPIFGG